eukprot:TRINITY_DN16183_c0_g1_i1.p1 TRINITY_DN16183_c0_g1~~TRINITY_DN16183_c0_g1_i1.p1  ORF type:complete len:144 (-),score=9.88 TRINITY_DN16183_c0_g1_i1:171-602(-)
MEEADMMDNFIEADMQLPTGTKRKATDDSDEEKSPRSSEYSDVLQRLKRIKFPLHITVKTLNGRAIELDIDGFDTIASVKQLISEREGIPPRQQKLVFHGKQIHDEATVEGCGIINRSLIYLVIALHPAGYSGISRDHRTKTD